MINLGFSTADSEIVSIHNIDWHKIELKIIDWKEQKLKIIFNDVLAYSFQYFQTSDYRNDTIYIVNNSQWLQEQVKYFLDNYPNEVIDHIRHYKLCFNVDDQELNIICSTDIKIEYYI